MVILAPIHVLHKLLPEVRLLSYHLRPWVQGFELPIKDNSNFITHLLYKDILY